MPEDEYDFEGLNPATLMVIDEQAKPFDYEVQLRLKGHTFGSPPDIGGLFKALATPYVPTRIVHLPPKVVERASLWESIVGVGIIGFVLLAVIYLYLFIFVVMGMAYPLSVLTQFELKESMRPGAFCTVTGREVDTYTVSNGDSGSYNRYSAYVFFTLRTLKERSYDTSEYWTPDYGSSSEAQAYISQYQVGYTYPCWYNPTDPSEAMFVRDITFGDYLGLFFSGCLFLLLGICPNVIIILSLCQSFIERRRRGRT